MIHFLVVAVLTSAQCCQSRYEGLVIDRIYITIGASRVDATDIIGARGRSDNTGGFGVYYAQATPDEFTIPPQYTAAQPAWDLCIINLNNSVLPPTYVPDNLPKLGEALLQQLDNPASCLQGMQKMQP